MAELHSLNLSAGLSVILVLVLITPFFSRWVERNLEIFLLVMGLCALYLSGGFTRAFVREALKEPILISFTVLVVGLLFLILRGTILGPLKSFHRDISPSLLYFLIIVTLGLLASFITAIIAALIFIEILSILHLQRKSQITITVLACYAIGLGAALTPMGEPLATIAVAKLDQHFFYLLQVLGPYIIPGIFALGFLAAFLVESGPGPVAQGFTEQEGLLATFLRALKVYIFVLALIFLGEGFKPLIERYILDINDSLLYWINMISAVLDNATLTAAEISPRMTTAQIRACLMGLLISGGMLIPGNIPNIICASKLGITSTQWARTGVPLGLLLLLVYYFILF